MSSVGGPVQILKGRSATKQLQPPLRVGILSKCIGMEEGIIVGDHIGIVKHKTHISLAFDLVVPPNFVRVGRGFVVHHGSGIGGTVLQVHPASLGFVSWSNAG